MATYSSLVAQMERTTVEDFGSTIRDATHDIDPWSKKLVESNMGVTRDGLGRGWQKIQVFKTGLGGAASWRSVAGPAPTVPNSSTDSALGDTLQFAIYGTPQTFPPATEHTVPAYVQKSCTLKEMYGSFTVPLEILRLDQLSTNMANQYAAIVDGAAKRVALREILAYWATSNGGYISLTASGTRSLTPTSAAGTPTTFTAADGLSYYDCLRIQAGETVDIFRNSSGTWTQLNATNQPVFVLHSDPVARQLTVLAAGGSDVTISTGYVIEFHPRSSSTLDSGSVVTSQPTPLESVIVNSGSPYGLSLTNYPYFKSVIASVDGPLTETILNRYVALAMHSKAMADRPDSLVTTPGVKANYIASLDYSGRREARRTPIRINDGIAEGWDYTYDGTNMSVDCSNFCPAGTLYGLKMREGNWKKIVPPKIPGHGTESKFGDGVEFVGSVTHPSIFVPTRATSTASMTDFVEAPFKRWVEFLPECISGLKITGLHELIGDEDGTST